MTKNRTMVCHKPECKKAVAHREEAVRFSSLSVGEDGLAPEIIPSAFCLSEPEPLVSQDYLSMLRYPKLL